MKYSGDEHQVNIGVVRTGIAVFFNLGTVQEEDLYHVNITTCILCIFQPEYVLGLRLLMVRFVCVANKSFSINTSMNLYECNLAALNFPWKDQI